MSRKNKSIFGSLLTTLFWVIFMVGLLLILFRVLVRFGVNVPVRSFVVQSGSMEPSIMTGDIILIREYPEYVLSDVVTFRDEKDRVVTHRIVEEERVAGKKSFLTKGDANRSIDIERILSDQVVGKVVLTIPKLGYLVSFAKSTFGIILLVIIPSSIIIYGELSTIASAYKTR